jgi:hypothetical protein
MESGLLGFYGLWFARLSVRRATVAMDTGYDNSRVYAERRA